MRAADVSRQLGDAGHQAARLDDDGYHDGYKCTGKTDDGSILVWDTHNSVTGNLYFLAGYRLALQNLGYTVDYTTMPDTAKPALRVTR